MTTSFSITNTGNRPLYHGRSVARGRPCGPRCDQSCTVPVQSAGGEFGLVDQVAELLGAKSWFYWKEDPGAFEILEKQGADLAALMGSFHFIVHGYDHDPHEVYAIEEVRACYRKLWAE